MSICLAAALVAVIFAAFWVLERKDERHRIERAALLNHIRFGERVPTRPAEWGRRPERERDELHRVGRIEGE